MRATRYFGAQAPQQRGLLALLLRRARAYTVHHASRCTTICPWGVYGSMLARHAALCPPHLLYAAQCIGASRTLPP